MGQIIDGVIKNLTDYGAFIDLGGIDGLLHITDMSWGRVNHPCELFQVGDEIKVKVLKFDPETERVSLGLKQIQPDPWIDAGMRYPIGKRVQGKVVSLTDYGAFVELEPGIEGLVHVSEMSWTKRVKHPSKMVSIGDMVEAVVLDVDEGNRKISLGMKQIEPNPWSVIEEKLPGRHAGARAGPQHHQLRRLRRARRGDRRPGARLGHLVDGADQAPEREVQEGRRGRGRRAQDRQGEREVLARHQAARAEPLGRHPADATRSARRSTGEVTSVTDFGAFVQLEEGIEGLIYSSELAAERVEKPVRRGAARASR